MSQLSPVKPENSQHREMLTGTNLKFTKAHNVRIVLDAIRVFGPISRRDIARRSELTAQTVSNITRKLIEAGMVVEAEPLQEGRGAPSRPLRLDADGAFSVGLDLDKDHLTAVLVDFTGSVRQRIARELDFPLPDEAIELMETTVRALLEKEGIDDERLWGIGVGLPGPLASSDGDQVSNLVNPKEFPGWSNVPIVEILEERLRLPVYLENNATAAAVGERWYGDGQFIRTFFYLFFGAGLGGGFIANGQPLEGSSGNAGEVGYFPIPEAFDGSLDVQQNYIGIHFSLPRLYRRLSSDTITVSRPSDLEVLLEQGNETLIEWMDRAIQLLLPLVLAVEYILDPDVVFFGGRLPDSIIRKIIAGLLERIPGMRIEGKRSHPQLLLATAGKDAAALGVATMPFYASFAPVPWLLMKQRGDNEKARLMPSFSGLLHS
jgi:predicted NBD/HSP70 family sugar kinase